MSTLYGKGGVESGSRLSGVGGLKSGSPVYGDGGEDSGSIIYGGYGDKHATRNIPTFDSTNYGTIDTPITFTGDFEVEVVFASTDTAAAGKGLFGYSVAGTTNFLQINNPSAQVNFTTVDGVVTWTHGNTHLDGRVHKLTAYRLGNILGIKIDGAIANTNDLGAASTVDIDVLGALSIATVISQQFNGQLLSTKFTDQSGSPDVITNYVFDSGSTTEQFARGSSTLKVTLTSFTAANWNRYTLQRNMAHDAGTIVEAWVGDNLVVNGAFDADTDWAKVSNWAIAAGIATFTPSDASNQAMTQSDVVSPSSVYLNKIQINRTTGNFQLYNGNGGAGSIRSASGEYTEILQAGSTATLSLFALAGFTGSIDNVSVQHLLEVA